MNLQRQAAVRSVPAPPQTSTHLWSGRLQRCTADKECDECRSKRLGMQRYAISDAPESIPPIVSEVLNSTGMPLDANTRGIMEARLGHHFGEVRIHADGRAAESAQAVNARAYTVGRDVVFGAGRYAPRTREGQKLLAHELTHVVQQRGTAIGMDEPIAIGEPQDAFERQADAISERSMQGSGDGSPVGGLSKELSLQRDDDDTKPTPPGTKPWDPEISLFIFIKSDLKDCLGGADRDGVISPYSRCGSPVKPPFCRSAHTPFEVTYRIDSKWMPRPTSYKVPKVSARFHFKPTKGQVNKIHDVSDNAPHYVSPGQDLEPKFGKDFPIDATESGTLKIELVMDDVSSGNKVIYSDSIEYDIQPCV